MQFGKCRQCKYWGDGEGTGIPYDAGRMNSCNHPKIKGVHHPSFEGTKVYVGIQEEQHLMTREGFGCILFEPIYIKVTK